MYTCRGASRPVPKISFRHIKTCDKLFQAQIFLQRNKFENCKYLISVNISSQVDVTPNVNDNSQCTNFIISVLLSFLSFF